MSKCNWPGNKFKIDDNTESYFRALRIKIEA